MIAMNGHSNALQDEFVALRRRIVELERANADLTQQLASLQHVCSGNHDLSPHAHVHFDRFFDLSSDMLCTAGLDGYLKRVNASWERVLGFTAAEMCAEPFLSFVHPDDRQATVEAVSVLSRGQPVFHFVNRYRSKDGTYRCIEWMSAYDPAQELIYAVARDVTNRVQIEEELRVFKALVDNAPDGVAVARPDGTLIYLNSAECKLFQWEEQPGSTMFEAFAPEDHDLIAQVAAQVARGAWQGELICRRRDGSQFPGLISAFPINDQAGNVVALAAITRDISAIKQTEKERAALQEQVIAAQQAALRELSTPLIPLNDTVVVMPLVGAIDTARAQQIMETLLEGIAHHQATVAILDITGVQVVDTQVANALVRAAQATRLLGAQVMLTGISPAMAQTLVHLGIDLQGIITRRSLQDGIALALRTGSNATNHYAASTAR